MTERQKQVTQWLFWGAFGVFLAVSIPHVAWVVDQYEPHSDHPLVSFFYSVLALGYAVAIDGIMAWLTHIQSSGGTQGRGKWDTGVTWVFIVALVMMSWYLNWVYNLAHDPSGQAGSVWGYLLTNPIGMVPALTVAGFTPVLLAALPVFTIAYVSILNKVNVMKAQNAKSLEELQREASEAEERATALARIRNAGKKDEDKAGILVSGAFGLVKKVQQEAQGLAGEKRDPQQEILQKLLTFFRGTPDLLLEHNAATTDPMIKEMLKLKRLEMARVWRIKVQHVLDQERSQMDVLPDDTRESNLEMTSSQEKETDPRIGAVDVDQNAVESEVNSSDSANQNAENDEDSEQSNESQNQFQAQVKMLVGRYPKLASWLEKSPRTVSIKELSNLTLHSSKMIRNRIDDGTLKRSRNPELVKVSSVLDWLLIAPLPEVKSQSTARLTIVKPEVKSGDESHSKENLIEDSQPENGSQTGLDKLQKTMQLLHQNPELDDAMLAENLGLARPASARFWRLKAMEMLKSNELVTVN